MQENPSKQNPTTPKRDDTATVVAALFDVTPAYVRMVMNGEYNNDDILNATILYKQGKNKLIKYIEQLVPVN